LLLVAEMVPGITGMLPGLTVKVCAMLLPQLLLAVTEIVPELVPAVRVIEFVLDVPVHPPGKVHV
jgi:hypothetical protein